MDTEALFYREAKDQGREGVPWAAWMVWSNDFIPAAADRTQDRLRAAVSGCWVSLTEPAHPHLGQGSSLQGLRGCRAYALGRSAVRWLRQTFNQLLLANQVGAEVPGTAKMGGFCYSGLDWSRPGLDSCEKQATVL